MERRTFSNFGLHPDDLEALAAAGFSESLQWHLAAPGAPEARVSSERGPERWRRVLEAAWDWNAGCAALDRGDASGAFARFTAAAGAAPEGRLFSLSAALALAALQRIDEADTRLALVSEWKHEPRYRRDTAEARELYESALADEKDWVALREIYLKLADLAYLAGDHASERRLREHYWQPA